MSEIMKCPECGNDPLFMPTHDQTDPYPEAVECCSAAFTTVAAWNKYVAIEASYNALREAVAWERECGTVSFTDLWFDEWNRTEDQSKSAMQELRFTRRAARSEVDRLLEQQL